MKDKLKKEIFDFLKDNEKRFFLINEIAFFMQKERHTISKYLKILSLEGKISFQKVGNCKVWTIKK